MGRRRPTASRCQAPTAAGLRPRAATVFQRWPRAAASNPRSLSFAAAWRWSPPPESALIGEPGRGQKRLAWVRHRGGRSRTKGRAALARGTPARPSPATRQWLARKTWHECRGPAPDSKTAPMFSMLAISARSSRKGLRNLISRRCWSKLIPRVSMLSPPLSLTSHEAAAAASTGCPRGRARALLGRPDSRMNRTSQTVRLSAQRARPGHRLRS